MKKAWCWTDFREHTEQALTAAQLFPEWKVIYLDVPEAIARARLMSRGQCDKCDFIGASTNDSCPYAGATLGLVAQRTDPTQSITGLL